MHEYIIQAVGILLYGFQGYCLNQLFDSFFKRKRLISFSFFIPCWTVFRSIFHIFVQIQGQPVFHIIFITISILGIHAVSGLLYEGEKNIRIYLSIIFTAVNELGFFVVFSLYTVFNRIYTGLIVRLVQKELLTNTALIEKCFLTGLNVLLVFLYIALSILIYCIFTKIIESYLYKNYKMGNQELFWLVTPALSGLFFSIVIKAAAMINTEDRVIFIYEEYPVMTLAVPAIAGLSLLSIIFSIGLLQNMISYGEEQKNMALMEHQVRAMTEHIGEIEKLYDGIRGLRHDMKNNIAVIRGLLESPQLTSEEKREQVNQYLLDMDETMEQMNVTFRTGNPVTDVVLHEKYKEAAGISGLDFQARQFIYPPKLCISGFDIGIILSNGLDNAIEACKKLKYKNSNHPVYIHVKSYQKGNMYFIEIENSFDGILKWGQSRFPDTTKEEALLHGMGLKNIERSAGKYYGTAQCMADEDRFTLIVMMENNGNDDN